MFGFSRKKIIEKKVGSAILRDLEEGIFVFSENGDLVFTNEFANKLLLEEAVKKESLAGKEVTKIDYQEKQYDVLYESFVEASIGSLTKIKIVDITQKNQLRSELEETKQKIDLAGSFKSAFFANMSHEIRTPIHAIIGLVEMIEKEENISENTTERLDMIKNSSYSLLAIINDVLDISKLETGKIELVKTSYYISYVIRDLEATFSLMAARKGLQFIMNLDENIPANLYGDKIRLRGILVNMLNNAVKFTKTGSVTLSIRVLEKKNEMVKLSFEVTDTGCGIKKEDIVKLFESFSRFDINSKYSSEGTGLGLSIANGYAKLMGGEILVESEYGKGSTFTLIVEQKALDEEKLDMNIVEARKKKDTCKFKVVNYEVLVVDDNPVNLMVADGLMKSYGMIVDQAPGGEEAIEACKKKNYDLILMDQMMPEVDGITALKEIRKLSEHYKNESKIVVLTADAMSGVRDRLIAEGFDEYLCKPMELHRLEETLKKFVPAQCIVSDNAPSENSAKTKIEDALNRSGHVKNEIDTKDLSEKIGISEEIILKKVSDSGGSFEDYVNICAIACKHADAKEEKLRESLASSDYRKFAVEMQGLKSSMATIGATELSDRAKELAKAGKEGNETFLKDNVEKYITDYMEFIKKLKTFVLKEEV